MANVWESAAIYRSAWLPDGTSKQVLIEVAGYWVNGVSEWVTLATPVGFTEVSNPAPVNPNLVMESLGRQENSLKPALHPNTPNPFNPETWIPYTLGQASEVVIEIYNVQGKRVRELKLGHREAGEYLLGSGAAYFDGRNASGDALASGTYFYRIKVGDFITTRSLVLLK